MTNDLPDYLQFVDDNFKLRKAHHFDLDAIQIYVVENINEERD